MLRIVYSVIRNLFRIYMIPLMRYMANHPEKFSTEKRYKLVRRTCYLAAKTTRIRTYVSGQENLPDNGGYMICPNHQGKYDALAIFNTHERPCSVVMDDARSRMPLVAEIIDLLQGKRMKKDDIRQSMSIIMDVAKEVHEGKPYIIFPEGGYTRTKKNTLDVFKPGAFKAALKSQKPIVPVALIDTYKAFNRNSLRRVITQVHYLEPIPYEMFKDMKTNEIAAMVQNRISEKITELVDTKGTFMQMKRAI